MHFNLFGRGRPLRWAISLACQVSFIFLGYDQGFMGGVLAMPGFMTMLGGPGPYTIGIMISIFNLGCCLGCLVNIIYGQKLGRRRALFITLGCMVVGSILQTASYGLAQLMVGRFVGGIGMGLISSTVPTYQSELCDARKRGILTCAPMCWLASGLVLSIFFDYGISKTNVTDAWRIPMGFQLVFVVICFFLLLGIPESPRWLFQQSRDQEAVDVLCAVWDKTLDDEYIVHTRDEILQSFKLSETHGKFAWHSLFQKDEVRTRRRLLLAIYIACINQLCGVLLIVYFMPTILITNVGVSPDDAILISGGIDTGALIGTLLLTLLVDKIGRRRPLIFSAATTAICMMVITILLSYRERSDHGQTLAQVASVFFALFLFTYTLGSGTLAWPVVPELLPLHARINGASIAAVCNWLFNFLIAMIAPVMIANLGWKLYIIWTCTNFVSVPILYLFMPEVKNLTLEEVDLIFTHHEHSPVQAAKRLQKLLRDNGAEGGREIMFQKMAQVSKIGTVEQEHEVRDVKHPVEHFE